MPKGYLVLIDNIQRLFVHIDISGNVFGNLTAFFDSSWYWISGVLSSTQYKENVKHRNERLPCKSQTVMFE